MQIVFDFRAELQKTQIVCFNSIKKIFLKPTKKNVIYFLSPFNNKEMTIANYNITIEITIKWKYDSKNSEELLAVVIDIVVTFVNHVENLYQKANQKLHALARVYIYIDKIVFKTHLFSKFSKNISLYLLKLCQYNRSFFKESKIFYIYLYIYVCIYIYWYIEKNKDIITTEFTTSRFTLLQSSGKYEWCADIYMVCKYWNWAIW